MLRRSLLKGVCHDVRTEPILQQLIVQQFLGTNSYHIRWCKVRFTARGFGAEGQEAFFDIRVFNSNATRYAKESLQHCYALNENEKKRK